MKCKMYSFRKIYIFICMSSGLGAGGSPAVGAQAATESRDEIMEMVKDADLVFVTAGMCISYTKYVIFS